MILLTMGFEAGRKQTSNITGDTDKLDNRSKLPQTRNMAFSRKNCFIEVDWRDELDNKMTLISCGMSRLSHI